MGFRTFNTLLLSTLCAIALGDATTPSAKEIESFYKRAKGKTTAQRIETVSLAFYGLPFIDNPLGEGPQGDYDQGPLYRFDGFDCTTFVETVVALATAKRAADFESQLRSIRYRGGKVGYAERNHFPCVDWIPNNTRSGLLTDITAEIGKPWGIELAKATVTKRSWFEKLPLSTIRIPGSSESERQKKLERLHSLGTQFPPQTSSVPYIALDKILHRKPVDETENARRKEEEKALATHLRQEVARAPKSDDPDIEKRVHDGLVDLRLKYLIQDVDVDPAFIDAIPSATLLNIVRPGMSIPGTRMTISHQGFVIRKKDGVYFRHVTKSGGRVKDVLLANYLRLCLLSPPIRGVQLLKIHELTVAAH